MKKALTVLTLITALTVFFIWAPDSSALPSYFNQNCVACHSSAPVTCAGCHYHGPRSLTAKTTQTTYAPGETVTVSVSSNASQSGWVRAILYDQDGKEIARSTNGMGGGPQLPGPIEFTVPAPSVPGTYTWYASWYGYLYRSSSGSANFVPDVYNTNHGEVTVSTNSFEVISQCDTHAPVVTTPANLVVTIPAGDSGPVGSSDPGIQTFLNSARATDVEDGNLPVTNNAPASFPVGTTPVTFFATDSCGNQGSATASVTIDVASNNLPLVTAPASIEVTAPLCQTSVPATDQSIAAFLNGATATDAEDGNVTASIVNDAPAEFPVGAATTVTFTASDSIGGTGKATATVSVNETPNTAPNVTAPDAITITVPADTISVPATDPAIASFLIGATGADAQDGDVSAMISHNAPANFPVGTTTVTFTAVDGCGVSTNADSTVTIQAETGNIAPVLHVPDQITLDAQQCSVSLPASDPAIVSFLSSATATDVEDGDVTSSIINDAPAEFPVGTTPVTFSVTDSSGATTTGVTSVIVLDKNHAPVVIGPAPLAITVATGTTSVPATDTALAAFLNGATATDVEDGDFSSSAITNNAPADFPLGDTVVTFTVKDSCGMTATTDSTVTITEDQGTVNTPPSETTTDDFPVDDRETVSNPPSEEDHDDHVGDYENEHTRHGSQRVYRKRNHDRINESNLNNRRQYHNEDQESSTKLRLFERERDDD